MNQSFLKKKGNLIINQIVPYEFSDSFDQKYQYKWITDVEKLEYLKIRNAPNVLPNMRDSSEISVEQHNQFLSEYGKIERLDLIIKTKTDDTLIGGAVLSKTHHGWEIGKFIGNSSYLGKGLSYPMMSNFLNFLETEFAEISTIISITKILNKKNIRINEKLGFSIVDKVDKEYLRMVR